ncbi:MAG TPA: radical SAM protein [Terriglobia bacterium]|nr:radical SAM protein [Terriglobia bacterium]
MNFPEVTLTHLDNLWFQVSGTLCNIACLHCFNNSGPNVRTFGFLSIETIREEIECAAHAGVKEIFFTGGEPFLHPRLPEMLAFALKHAPTTVLTNGMLINDRIAGRLAAIERSARYSLEIRVSLDGYTEEMNDAIRGEGVFHSALEGVRRLSGRGLLPLVTVVRTWSDDEELHALAAFSAILRAAGYDRPRIKVLPALPLGRELERRAGIDTGSLLSEEMLDGFDRELLMCSNSRVVTDRGIWVCPLLVEKPDARLGQTLADARPNFALGHNACVTCYHYGTICGNVSSLIEGPASEAGANKLP